MLELGHSISSEDTLMASMTELMPTLEVLVAGLGWLVQKAINAICDKEDLTWTDSVNGSSVQVCHLQEVTLTWGKDSPRIKAMRPIGDLLAHCRQLKKLALAEKFMADLMNVVVDNTDPSRHAAGIEPEALQP